MIIYSERAVGWQGHAALAGYAVAGAVATFACLAAAAPITRLLGRTGINVMTRLMGLTLAAIGVEIMASGLLQLLPGLGR